MWEKCEYRAVRGVVKGASTELLEVWERCEYRDVKLEVWERCEYRAIRVGKVYRAVRGVWKVRVQSCWRCEKGAITELLN